MGMMVETRPVEGAVALIPGRVPGDEAAPVEGFLRRYYARVAEEDLADREPEDVLGAALAHLRFAELRARREAKVRAYVPESEEHGWAADGSVVEVVTDDMPFLVDSVTMEFNRSGYGIRLLVHPVVRVRRNGEGRLLELLPPDVEGGVAESFIHVELDRRLGPEELDGLRRDLLGVLGEVRAAVEDFEEMRERTREATRELELVQIPGADGEDLAEARALMEWMERGNFIFLGYREYGAPEGGRGRVRSVPGRGLGILRDEGEPPEEREPARSGGVLELTKANAHATVHRPADMDEVVVKRLDASGAVVGERRFLGLYTSAAYASNPREVPVLRRKVARVLERAALPEGGHDEKVLVDILRSYPRDELFQVSQDELFETAMGILNLQQRRRVRVFVRRDSHGRFFSCLVFVPRDRYDTQAARRVEAVLSGALGGGGVESSVALSGSVLARLHVIVYSSPDADPGYDVGELEARVAEAVRSWEDGLSEELAARFGEEGGRALFGRYGGAFAEGYRADHAPREAVEDVEGLERLAREDGLVASLYRPPEGDKARLRFRLIGAREGVALSDALPILEDMGVRVLEARPYQVSPADAPVASILDFGLVHDGGSTFEIERLEGIFREAFARVWRGEAESDGANRLVLRAGLDWREVSVLRAYGRYMRQAGSPFGQTYVERALYENPGVARLLVALFRARLDPAAREGADARAAELASRIEAALDAVESLDQDRILRGFLSLVLATLRTNYFQRGPDGAPEGYLSFKLDPKRVPNLPLPLPMFEVFVYSPRVEGVHLRGGRVARGGLRWSDRREDFRTEVLGLMKAQQVKNAVIVPVGAKGGFVVKRPPSGGGREALMGEVVECYKTFIRGLLDLTDNLSSDGAVVPPERVVRHDGDDPYLVVAADKGTATFSDIANGISKEYGFWLGDAFASGGSAGYDHKAMGITARGAWESVKRHFRELGIDPERDDFTVVGIGDMSGDVFGNGMLLSRRIKLVGTFEHRHVFLDPDPDPERSFEERKRLFGLPRSSWSDYDASLISEGGGVYPRTAKSVPLSPQAKRLLGVEEDALTPSEVIRALLKTEVDLLYNGGIGTYVKASDEMNADVGDRSNDALRVDARELRCRTVGEGGNLGFTQRGRVEYALSGGKVNTDAIDNSAGVDASDHEVNIKVLLDDAVKGGSLTQGERDGLLAALTGEVAALVLADNREQNRALANAARGSRPMAGVHARHIRALEGSGRLDRELESLPDEEALHERRAGGGGLTVPELAVLMAYAKNALYEELLASDVPEDPYLSGELAGYFPRPLRERFGGEISGHRLRREIVATRLANGVVNRAGITFVFRMGEETGATAPEVVRAYAVAREAFVARELWAEIEAAGTTVPPDAHTGMFLEARRAVERATRWLLRNRRPPLDVAGEATVFAGAVRELSELVPGVLPAPERARLGEASRRYAEAGAPRSLAERLAKLPYLLPALDAADTAAETGEPLGEVAAMHFVLGERLRLDWLRGRVEALPRDDLWQTLARNALRGDLQDHHAALVAEALRATPRAGSAAGRAEAWISANNDRIGRALAVLRSAENHGAADLYSLTVAVHEIHALAQHGTNRASVTR